MCVDWGEWGSDALCGVCKRVTFVVVIVFFGILPGAPLAVLDVRPTIKTFVAKIGESNLGSVALFTDRLGFAEESYR